MAETRNEPLAAWMTAHEMSAPELADSVNRAIGIFAGRPGTASERTVHRWLSGDTRWPQARQRRGLEAVTGLAAADLGFVPRGRYEPGTVRREDPDMRRRSLFGAAAGTAAAALLTPSRPSRVGTSDVIRLRDGVERLLAVDAERGGHGLERAALAGAAEALRLQQQSTTQRVRQRLYTLAADFTATAAWALIDASCLDGAAAHLDRALTFAGLAQDSETTMQVWNLRAMLARQRRDYLEAVASSQAAQTTAIARRSPLHTSLGHARTAVGLAHGGEHCAALRHLGRAETALAKADPYAPCSPWIAFYGEAELHFLTAIVRDVAGHAPEAEAAAHRALAALPETYRRNRGMATARLALAQIHQGDVEQACATSSRVFEIMAGAPLPGRVRQLLGDFQRDLIALAPAAAHEWMDRHRTEWSRS
ncbi:XRE family transcriptional regulator [Streptomyces sp. NPDC048659]|uniref:XRE family transcriptional regulator n=1 Tax=Streptomyces sp. NPDC048659 TaxID=3155489 RepID=UPI003424F557